jgi:hypothetical protein
LPKSERRPPAELLVFDDVLDASTHGLAATVGDKRNPNAVLPELAAGFQGRRFSGLHAAAEAAHKPWPEGLAIIEDMLQRLDDADLPQPVSRRRKRVHSEDDGDEVCVDRYLRGRDDLWEARHKRVQRAPAVVTIATNLSANCGVDHKSILWRGAAAVCLATLLERANYSADLWAVIHGRNGMAAGRDGAPCSWVTAINVKQAGQTIDLGTITAAVSGWFFRTVGFMTANAAAGCHPCYSLGQAGKIGQFLPEFIRTDEPIIIDEVWDYNAAVELVRESLLALHLRTEEQLQA